MGKDLNGKELGTGLRQRKDGRYEARAKVNDVNISIYNFKLKDLKEEFKIAKEEAMYSAERRYANITLTEWFEEWFDNYKVPYVKPTSIFSMKSKYYNTFGRLIGDVKVVDIKNLNIQYVINTLQSEGRAPSSMKEALGRVRECLESARNNNIISSNPCFDIKVPWQNKKLLRRFLSIEEQDIFLEQAQHNWYEEMFQVMFLTGMRVGEVGGLRWDNIDFQNKCINITHSLSCNYNSGEKKMLLTTPKTFSSYRKIPFMGNCEEVLIKQKEKVADLKKRLGKRYRGKGEYENLVFVSTLGSPVIRHIAEKEINKIVVQINEKRSYESQAEGKAIILFEKVYPHAIRHTFCSRCFEKDMNPKVVQKIMGHQNYSTTIDVYTHISDNKLEEEIAKWKEN